MKIEIKDNRAFVYAPYHPDFYRKIKRCGSARWDATRRAWQVDVDQIPVVRKHMIAVFGECDIPAEDKRYDVELHFRKEVWATCEGVYFYGKCLARASGRDSGTRPGNGVCYLEGACRSGGSAKYWCSQVDEGSVVMLYDIPETLVLQEDRCDGVDYKFIERVTRKDELEAEKARLMARVAEIDNML